MSVPAKYYFNTSSMVLVLVAMDNDAGKMFQKQKNTFQNVGP